MLPSVLARHSAAHLGGRVFSVCPSARKGEGTRLGGEGQAIEPGEVTGGTLVPPSYGVMNSRSSRLTTSTGQGALRITFSATLPKRACVRPVRPWVAMTIRSMLLSRA